VSLFGGKRKPTLFLHAGLAETGTSTIQRTLAANRAALAAAGVVYPTAGTYRDAHHELAWLNGFVRGRPPAVTATPEDIVAAWRDEIGGAKDTIGIVSSEYLGFAGGEHEKLANLLEPHFELAVVLYLHRHDLWMPAVYTRAVCTNTQPAWGRGYENFLRYRKEHGHGKADHFRPIVETWGRAIGRENVLVRPFEVSQIGDDIVGDLLRTCGAPAAALAALPPTPEPEPALSYEAINFIDIVQHTSLPAEIKRHLAAGMVAEDDGPTVGVPLASAGVRAGQIAANFDDYEFIAHRYLDRKDGQLFLEPTPSDERGHAQPLPVLTHLWLAEHLCRLLGQADGAVLEVLRAYGAREPQASGPT
jgi:hypothetical protein